MTWIFRAIADRLKAMFVADVATDFEAQLLARDAERKAELLRQAQKYEDEGLLIAARNEASSAPKTERHTLASGTEKRNPYSDLR